MPSRTLSRSHAAVGSLVGTIALAAGFLGVLAFAFFQIPRVDVLDKTGIEQAPPPAYLFPPKTSVSSAKIPVNPYRSNGALDVQVVVDTGFYTYDGVTAQGAIDMTDQDIEETIALASLLFAEKTGVSLHLRGIERRSLAHLSYAGLSEWARDYLETVINPPEAFIIFSLRDGAWMYGGFARLSTPVSSDSTYCNEFVVNQGLAIPEQRIAQEQRNAGIALINWEHKFGSCGYTETFPRRSRVSKGPQRGECRNNPDDTCVVGEAGYFQCASVTHERAAKPLFFRASTIVHELMHTLDVQEYGHLGEDTCQTIMAGDPTFAPQQLVYSEEWFSMCPASFRNVISQRRSCR
jgi:hypothetical protein